MYWVEIHLHVLVKFNVFLDWLDIIGGLSKPMTKLLEKDKKFKWMPTYEASFQELKK
jgi:hypothetical protein